VRAMRAICMAAMLPVFCAQAADVHELVTNARQRIEKADLRASGHLVWVKAGGERTSFPISFKAHWFPNVLRVLVDIGQPSSVHNEMREHVLLEMKTNGESIVQIAHPGDATAHTLPFDKWSVELMGPTFSYEDFLEEQYFWPGQSAEGTAKYGARDCDIIKSTPGAGVRTHYSEVKTWLDQTIDFPVYVEKTVKETGAVKEFTYFGIRHDEGVWSAKQIEVKTHGQQGSTLLIIDRGSTKANLTVNDFSSAELIRF
jgi:hypothetical protein